MGAVTHAHDAPCYGPRSRKPRAGGDGRAFKPRTRKTDQGSTQGYRGHRLETNPRLFGQLYLVTIVAVIVSNVGAGRVRQRVDG
jgi:hypothetical protein